MFVFDNQRKLTHTFDKNTFDRKDVYKRIFGDTIGYFKRITAFEKQLTEVGKTDVAIVSCHIDRTGKVFLELLMYYAELEKDNSGVGVKPTTIVVEWEKDKIFHNFRVNQPISFTNNSGYYGLLTDFSFDITEKSAYTINAHIKPDSINTVFISKLKIQSSKDKKTGSNKGFYFDSFTKLKFPSFAVKSKTEYMFTSGKLLYPFYFFSYENLVGNIETGEYFPLNDFKFSNNYAELLKKFNFEYQMVDIQNIKKNQYRYLVNFKNTYFIYDFDAQTKKSILYKEIALPSQKNFISQPVLGNNNTILLVSNAL